MRKEDRACPICGAPLPRGAAIPVRRYGLVPPYPEEAQELLADDSPEPPAPRRRLRLVPLMLAVASALALGSCARLLWQ